MNQKLKEKLKKAFEKDPTLVCDRASTEETLGNDVHYLEEILGLTKSDLIRLERLGLAIKARYEVARRDQSLKCGTHRVRWIIYKEALE